MFKSLVKLISRPNFLIFGTNDDDDIVIKYPDLLYWYIIWLQNKSPATITG